VARERGDEGDAIGGVAAVAVEAVAAIGEHAEAPVIAHAAERQEPERRQHLGVGAAQLEEGLAGALARRGGGDAVRHGAEQDVVERIEADLERHAAPRRIERDVGADAGIERGEELGLRVREGDGKEHLARGGGPPIEIEVAVERPAYAEIARQ